MAADKQVTRLVIAARVEVAEARKTRLRAEWIHMNDVERAAAVAEAKRLDTEIVEMNATWAAQMKRLVGRCLANANGAPPAALLNAVDAAIASRLKVSGGYD